MHPKGIMICLGHVPGFIKLLAQIKIIAKNYAKLLPCSVDRAEKIDYNKVMRIAWSVTLYKL